MNRGLSRTKFPKHDYFFGLTRRKLIISKRTLINVKKPNNSFWVRIKVGGFMVRRHVKGVRFPPTYFENVKIADID